MFPQKSPETTLFDGTAERDVDMMITEIIEQKVSCQLIQKVFGIRPEILQDQLRNFVEGSWSMQNKSL